MSAAVVQDGEIVWEHGFGFQNVAARVRATPDTPYLVGDISATLAAVLLLQCVEEKRITLDDPITNYVSYPEPGVTLRQALSHTSTGAFVYSPERFAQLGPVLEYCVPQPYAKTVAHRLLDRLAMRDSVPGTNLGVPDPKLPDDEFEQADLDRYRGVVERMAVPYKVEGRGRVQQTDIPIDGIGATSGLVSTVRDLARLEKGIDSGLLLRDETLQQAWSPVAAGDGGAGAHGPRLVRAAAPGRPGRLALRPRRQCLLITRGETAGPASRVHSPRQQQRAQCSVPTWLWRRHAVPLCDALPQTRELTRSSAPCSASSR